jgi:hypothetical protein
MSNPTFSIRDNADGTATVFDGGVPIATIERKRGTYERDRDQIADYVHLAYVARGHSLRSRDGKHALGGAHFYVSVASSSNDVEENADPARVAEMMAAARPLYVAGRVAEMRRFASDGRLDADDLAQIVEWIPKWRSIGEDDLADAMAEFVAEATR